MKALKSIITGVALSAALSASAFAAGVELNASSTGLALQGYDPVAYFTDGQPAKGNWKITAAFEANPEAYLPQYGGYCAFGAAMGFKFDGDPNHWKIVDGELFLNISKDIQERWVTDISGFITKADENWTEIADKDPAALQQ